MSTFVRVTKEVDADSVEARKAASSGPTAPPQPSSSQSSASKLAGLGYVNSIPGCTNIIISIQISCRVRALYFDRKRPGSAGGLGSVLGKISKKPKLGTLVSPFSLEISSAFPWCLFRLLGLCHRKSLSLTGILSRKMKVLKRN